MKMATARSRASQWWQREIRLLLVLAIILFSMRSSLADWSDAPSGSMEPTIQVGDRIFVGKLAHDLKVPFTTWHLAEWSNPQRGDIEVFYSPKDSTRRVKRVVGLPGDLAKLLSDQLIINGKPVHFSPLAADVSVQLPVPEQQHSLFATEHLSRHLHAVMPEGCYFMMGDNRDNSSTPGILDSCRASGSLARRLPWFCLLIENITGTRAGSDFSCHSTRWECSAGMRLLQVSNQNIEFIRHCDKCWLFEPAKNAVCIARICKFIERHIRD